jgi:hypothetical protein
VSWTADTDWILDESGSVVVTVYSASFNHSATIPPTETTTVVETSTVYLFPRSGMLVKDERGQIIDKLDMIVFPSTSDIAVTHRIFESGTTEYYEVERVDDFHGHKEIHAKKVEGR